MYSVWRASYAEDAEDNEAMTSPFQPGQVPGATPGTPAASRRAPGLPTPPKGWPAGYCPTPWGALTPGLVAGGFFGLISSAVPYAMARGTRDFSSTMQLVAGRYDVLCDPQNAEKAGILVPRCAFEPT